MKNYFIFILLGFCILLTCIACGTKKEVNQVNITESNMPEPSSYEDDISISSMIFAKLPSPPKCKNITDEKTIDSILDTIDKCEKKEIEPSGAKGWSILINVVYSDESRKQYSLNGIILRVDSQEYEVSKSLSEDLIKIYDSLDVQEKEYKEE